jgi:hypothetical protein
VLTCLPAVGVALACSIAQIMKEFEADKSSTKWESATTDSMQQPEFLVKSLVAWQTPKKDKLFKIQEQLDEVR